MSIAIERESFVFVKIDVNECYIPWKETKGARGYSYQTSIRWMDDQKGFRN